MKMKEQREDGDMIRGHRRTLLDGLRYHGGSANTSELRAYGDIPVGSIWHHLSVLEEWELICQQGTERLDNGETANIYHLTDDGSDAAEEIAESTTTAETVVSLEREVNQQQEQLETLRDEVKTLREEVDELNELRAEFNRMAKIVEDLARQEQ